MTRRISFAFMLCCALIPAAGLVVACSDDDDVTPVTPVNTADSGAEAEAAAPAAKGTVSLSMSYAGTETGPVLYAAIFAENGSIASVQEVMNPNFASGPIKATAQLAPGMYAAIGYIDVAGNSPMGPGAEDPFGEGTPFTVVSGETVNAELVIKDPAPSDAGADADAASR